MQNEGCVFCGVVVDAVVGKLAEMHSPVVDVPVAKDDPAHNFQIAIPKIANKAFLHRIRDTQPIR